MAAPNLFNPTSCIGQVAGQVLATGATNIVANAAASGKHYRIDHLVITNIAAVFVLVTVQVSDGTTTWTIGAFGQRLEVGQSITVFSKDRPLVLLENWSLKLSAGAAASAHAIAVWDEIS